MLFVSNFGRLTPRILAVRACGSDYTRPNGNYNRLRQLGIRAGRGFGSWGKFVVPPSGGATDERKEAWDCSIRPAIAKAWPGLKPGLHTVGLRSDYQLIRRQIYGTRSRKNCGPGPLAGPVQATLVATPDGPMLLTVVQFLRSVETWSKYKTFASAWKLNWPTAAPP